MRKLNPITIYALIDPRDGDVFYVGQTGRPEQRLVEHIREARLGKGRDPIKCGRIRAILAAGAQPIMHPLELVPDGDTDAEERWSMWFGIPPCAGSDGTPTTRYVGMRRRKLG